MDLLDGHFVHLILDQDFDDVAVDMQAEFTPTTQFLNYRGDIIWQTIGYKNPQDYLKELQTVLELWKEPQSD